MMTAPAPLGRNARQARCALRNWGEFWFTPPPLCATAAPPLPPATGSGRCTPWVCRQLMYTILVFEPAPPALTPVACEAAGAGPLEHPAASSPATASAPAAKHVRIVHPPD